MKIESENDFKKLQSQFSIWKKRFPMFIQDVRAIEKIVDNHIQNHSRFMVLYRQTHNKSYVERAQKEIDQINTTIETVAKIELMAMLSRG